MIRLNEGEPGFPKPAFSARAMMRSLERELARKRETRWLPSDEAQQLFYDAMEAPTDEEESELLQEALKLDPGNVDALLMVLRHRPLPEAEGIEVLRKIVALGEQRLGPEALQGFAGHFWGALETRPYMRAREQLADALRHAGRLEEAVAEWEAMLELNPNDNQGVRYALLACVLALKRLDEARRLFQKYNECQWNTVFAWGRVLERLLSADLAGAESAAKVARKQNPHMEAYLKSHRRLPKHLPDGYAPGSKEEAVCFADVLRMAWRRHPEAWRWLARLPSKRA